MPTSLSSHARLVLARRYLRRGLNGEIVETPEELFARVAAAVAAADARYGASEQEIADVSARFEERMARLEFLPNSPTLMNAGTELGQLAACFVIPVADSTAAIFDAVGAAAQIQKSGGGTGFSFSRLRPRGDLVETTGGESGGPISFMQVFDAATDAIKQGGKRRGANMGVLRVDHPDILDFIALKLDPEKMKNFNLSVAITDAFMKALESGADYDLINPRTGEAVGQKSARKVFDLIVNAAWAVGDPGLVFIDRMNQDHPVSHLGAIEATNPCGEQPLLPNESCTLGSINLAPFCASGALDWDALGGAVTDAVHFLDNVIDTNRYPLAAIEEATLLTRKIGLGVMGFADALIELGIAYDSPEAEALADRVARFLCERSVTASEELATSRGVFPAFDGSRWDREHRRLRNATTTTVAPTGTISLIAGCSSGIEPLFAVAFSRHVLDGEALFEVHPGLRRRLDERGLWSDEIASAIEQRGSVRELNAIPADIRNLFPTAHEIAAEVHIRVQAAFQRSVHASVSKTINLPHDATPADVARCYRLSYRLGCKGITVYRDGARAGQVLRRGRGGGEESGATGMSPSAVAPARCPDCGETTRHDSSCVVCRHCGWSACFL